MPQNTDRYFYIHSMSFEISDVRLGQKGRAWTKILRHMTKAEGRTKDSLKMPHVVYEPLTNYLI